MRHEKIKELLPLYIDNSLTVQEEELINNHLEDCTECQEELKEYQQNYQLLSSLEKEKAPIDLVDSIINKINQNVTEEKSYNDNNKKNILKRIKDLFILPVKVPAGIISLAAAILLMAITTLPANFLSDNDYLNKEFQAKDESRNYQIQNYNQSSQAIPETRMKITGSSQQENNELLTDSSDIISEQKIIKRGNLIIEVNKIDKVNNNIINLIDKYEGYLSNSRNWINQDKQKFYWFEIKIPADNFNKILGELSSQDYGQIISRSTSSQDVTEEYMDLDIRLTNLSSQEERYRKLLDKATEVEEILKIENELNRIRTEIERLQGRKKYLDNQISYSTITVEFHQPEPIGSTSPGIIKAIRNAINRMVVEFYQIIILIGTGIPYLLLFTVGYLIYKKRSSRN